MTRGITWERVRDAAERNGGKLARTAGGYWWIPPTPGNPTPTTDMFYHLTIAGYVKRGWMCWTKTQDFRKGVHKPTEVALVR